MLLSVISCKKMVEIPPPETSITTLQVFKDSSNMAAAVAGIYSEIEYGIDGIGFCNGAQTIYCGASADELVPFVKDATNEYKMYVNELLSSNGAVYTYFWEQPYELMYRTNACIEGIAGSTSVSQSARDRFMCEAKFLRALFYFYLVNLYGDVPYVSTTEWKTTSLLGRTPAATVYDHIIEDLRAAQQLLPTDYTFNNEKRTRAYSSAATALLARVYLYTGKWYEAETQASSLIEQTGIFHLADSLNDVFAPNNPEAILQWELNTTYGKYNSTKEGSALIPVTDGVPDYYVSDQLINTFEEGDWRMTKWLNIVRYNDVDYTIPYKYKVGPSQQVLGADATEYTTVLRLAEQYLIRAEARAQQGNVSGAADDLNVIRTRAGLPNTTAVTQQEMLDAVMQERRVELFAEWGHRWFDLKRTGRIDAVMSATVPQKFGGATWNSYQQWYPIPQAELESNPNLVQTTGY